MPDEQAINSEGTILHESSMRTILIRDIEGLGFERLINRYNVLFASDFELKED